MTDAKLPPPALLTQHDDVPLADSTVWKLCDSLMFETLGAPPRRAEEAGDETGQEMFLRDRRVPQVYSPPVSDSTMSEGRRQLKYMLVASGQAIEVDVVTQVNDRPALSALFYSYLSFFNLFSDFMCISQPEITTHHNATSVCVCAPSTA